MLAIFSDVHGNDHALARVLADAKAAGATRWVCLGDVAFNGPQPLQALARVRKLGCPVVMGNTDAWLLDSSDAEAAPEVVRARRDWCAKQLDEDDLAFIRTFLPTVALDLDGLEVMCFHGSPRNFDDVICDVTSTEALDPMLAGAPQPLLSGGHTHVPLLRRLNAQTLMNPGSVGLACKTVPQHGGPMRVLPVAEYALVSVRQGVPNITFRRLPLALDEVLGAARASGLPHAEAWCALWETPA